MNELQRVLSNMTQPFQGSDAPKVTAKHASEVIAGVDELERLFVWTDEDGNEAVVNDVGNGWYNYVGPRE